MLGLAIQTWTGAYLPERVRQSCLHDNFALIRPQYVVISIVISELVAAPVVTLDLIFIPEI